MGQIIYPEMRKNDVDKVEGNHYVVGTSKRTLEDYGVNDTLFGDHYSILTMNGDDVLWVEGFSSIQGCLNRLGDTPGNAVEFLTLR
jgi:hypothetical protein